MVTTDRPAEPIDPAESKSDVACIGGGHGLAASLRALRPLARDLTAIVSVADDGSSSGRLRSDLGILPPGDLRRCLSALAAPDSVLGQALEHRFDRGDLKGHALGNLLIAGLLDQGTGIEEALSEVARIVGAVGQVLPAATVPVTLTAERGRGHSVEGQVHVQRASDVHRVGIMPADPPTPTAVAGALHAADLVVLGPGSLFTSVLAAAIVPGVAGPLDASPATRVLVLNLGPQMGETEGLAPTDHVRLALDHGVPVDVVLADPRFAPDEVPGGPPVVLTPVGEGCGPIHDPVRLGAALRGLVGTR